MAGVVDAQRTAPPAPVTPSQPPPADAAAGRAGLLALSAAAFLVSLDRAIFAPLLPAVAHDLATTIAAAGLAVTAYTLPYGFCQLFYGPVADRAGKVAVVRWAVLVFAIGTGLCGLASHILVLDALRAVTGGAAAAVIPLALAYIGDVVPYGRRQQTIASLMGVTSLGGALSTAVGGVVGDFLSWRALFACYGVCALAVTAALFRVRSAPPVQGPGPQAGGWGWHRFGRVLGNPQARVLFVLVGLEGLLVQGGFTYLGAYLRQLFALDYLVIGLLLACYGGSTVLTSRALRRIHASWGERRLLLVGGLLLAAGYLWLVRLPAWPLFAVSMLAMGAGFSLFHSTLQTRATELVPELRGTSVALFAFFLFMGAGFGTAAMGWLVTTAGYPAMVLLCGLGLLAITLAAWRTPAR